MTQPADIHVASAAGFGGDMSVYERGRPSYPADAVDWLVDGLQIGPGKVVVDLAAGTGKFTRLLLPTGADVLAVEPSSGMREEFGGAVPGVDVLEGSASSIPLGDASVDAVTVAQAFHWFDVAAATAELARVVKPGGGIGLIWNERDAREPWVAELSRVIRWDRRAEYRVPYTVEQDWQQVFAERAHPRFRRLERFDTTYVQPIDTETLVLRVLSTSYIAASSEEEQSRIEREVRAVVAGFPDEYELPYVTVAYRS
jgi:ubiquinone/menaquinone biosynthesis C-methylase UbiE